MLDMDQVLCDFHHGMKQIAPDLFLGEGPDYEERSKLVEMHCKNNPRIFRDLKPIEGAVEAVKQLFEFYDIYFLSTPMCCLPESFMDKRLWLETHFGDEAKKKLILTHRKDLVTGDILVDDRKLNGAGEFKGRFIHFGTEKWPNWEFLLRWFLDRT